MDKYCCYKTDDMLSFWRTALFLKTIMRQCPFPEGSENGFGTDASDDTNTFQTSAKLLVTSAYE